MCLNWYEQVMETVAYFPRQLSLLSIRWLCPR